MDKNDKLQSNEALASRQQFLKQKLQRQLSKKFEEKQLEKLRKREEEEEMRRQELLKEQEKKAYYAGIKKEYTEVRLPALMNKKDELTKQHQAKEDKKAQMKEHLSQQMKVKVNDMQEKFNKKIEQRK